MRHSNTLRSALPLEDRLTCSRSNRPGVARRAIAAAKYSGASAMWPRPRVAVNDTCDRAERHPGEFGAERVHDAVDAAVAAFA